MHKLKQGKIKYNFIYLALASVILTTFYGTLLYYMKDDEIGKNVLPQGADSVKLRYPGSSVRVSKKFMTSLTSGRLGNKMGIHAAALGLAEMNGYKVLLERSMAIQLAKYFDLQTPTMNGTEDLVWQEIAPTHYMQDEYRDLNYENVRLVGFVNSWTFYHHIRPVILKEFTFKKALQDEAQMILSGISNQMKRDVTFVGVHVRRGDYVHRMRTVYEGVIANKDYIEQAMNIFRERYKNPVFVVVSDDREWCKDNMNSSLGDVFIVENNSSPGQDMATLVACNHTIMTVGTFGFWAGYLCGGDVVYLTNYTLPGAKRLNIPRYNSSFLPEWQGIAADLTPLLLNYTNTVQPA